MEKTNKRNNARVGRHKPRCSEFELVRKLKFLLASAKDIKAMQKGMAITQRRIIERIIKMAKTADEILALTTEAETVGDSAIALLTGLKQQLRDILAGGGVIDSAKLDAIFDKVASNKAKLEAAIVANTDAAPA